MSGCHLCGRMVYPMLSEIAVCVECYYRARAGNRDIDETLRFYGLDYRRREPKAEHQNEGAKP